MDDLTIMSSLCRLHTLLDSWDYTTHFMRFSKRIEALKPQANSSGFRWFDQYISCTLFQLQLHLHLVPRAGRERYGDGDGHDDAAAHHGEPPDQSLHQAEAPVQGDGGPVKVSSCHNIILSCGCHTLISVSFVIGK